MRVRPPLWMDSLKSPAARARAGRQAAVAVAGEAPAAAVGGEASAEAAGVGVESEVGPGLPELHAARRTAARTAQSPSRVRITRAG